MIDPLDYTNWYAYQMHINRNPPKGYLEMSVCTSGSNS